MVPYCRKLIDTKLLSEKEREWVDRSHREIWERVGESGVLRGDERAREWLRRETEPL